MSANRPSAAISSGLADFLETPSRQAGVVRETGHRPWPLPEREWVQAQTWDRLLFAHWRVPVSELQSHVPAQLPIDTFDGSAWVGITPFKLNGLRIRGLLPIPHVSSFLELNVRTYVRVGDKAGIYFFSLDAASALAVEGARRTYRLPYFRARMSADVEADAVDYRSRRDEDRPATFRGTYGPAGAVSAPRAGSLEYFLTERYCLFTIHDGDVHWAQIHHPPWPLQPAEGEVHENSMPPPGLELRGDPLLHYSSRQDVVIWSLERFAA